MERSSVFTCTGICSTCGRCQNGQNMADAIARKTRLLYYPEDFVPQEGRAGYGIAFDVGTTTVVGILWDRTTGKQLGTQAQTNPQNRHGLDVISRITYCQNNEEKLQEMQGLAVGAMNEIAKTLSARCAISAEEIIACVICGNTTMSHIIAGYDPLSLAVVPFNPSYTGTLHFPAKDLGMEIGAEAVVTLVPNIASHVGGDITAGVVACRLLQVKALTVFIDIGTNGEIVIAKEGKAFTCSTAAGPAFEGATIYQGMRSAQGAIEAVSIDQDVTITTIGNVPAVGICGSGLIQAVWELVRLGIVNKHGRMATQADLEARGLPVAIANRCRQREGLREFVLSYGEAGGVDVVLTQKDIREVQLAKGAIAAGILALVSAMEATVEDIHQIYIAGAFGSYIDKASAIGIGLLPAVGVEKLVSIGNTAGVGCAMALMNPAELEAMEQATQVIEHIELAACPQFQDEYLKAMGF